MPCQPAFHPPGRVDTRPLLVPLPRLPPGQAQADQLGAPAQTSGHPQADQHAGPGRLERRFTGVSGFDISWPCRSTHTVAGAPAFAPGCTFAWPVCIEPSGAVQRTMAQT